MSVTHDLAVEYVPLEQLKTYPGNARLGDVDAIVDSMEENGVFSPIVVQLSTSYVIDGNHRYLAMQQRGDETAPVVFVDVDDERAKRIVLAANRTNDLASYDEKALVDLLTSLPDLHGTGFTDDDLSDLVDQLNDIDLLGESGDREPGEGGEGDDGPDEEDEGKAELSPDRGALLKLADLGWNEPKTETHQGEHWRLGHHHLFIVDVTRDHAAYSAYLVEGTLFAPYPNPHLTGTVTARETPLVLVQPRALLAGHLIDKYIALFGDADVVKVEAAE